MATNIYNATTGQTGYQVPGATLQSGWQWGAPVAPSAGMISAATPPTSLPTVPTNTAQTSVPGVGMVSNPSAYGYNPTPAVPSTTVSSTLPVGTQNTTATDPTLTSNTMLQNVLALMTPSTNELGLQSTLAAQEASRRQSILDINNQPIATPFQTGQAAAVTNAANAGEANTQGALTIAQNQRLASLDAAKTALDFSKPTTVGMGTNLVSPLTGATVAEGQSYAGKQGAANVLALSKMYPDAGILPTDDPSVAAQKASNAPSFIAKYGRVNYQWNPNTGQFEMLSTNRLDTTTPGAGYTGNPNGTGTNLGVSSGTSSASPSGAGIGGVSIVDYLNSIGKDSSHQALATIAANAGMQNYTGTAQQNTQLLSMLRQGGGTIGATAGGMASVPIGNGAAPTASTAATSSTPFGLNLSNKIDSGALSYIQTGDMPSGIYPADQAAVRARAQQVIPGFNPAIAKANAKAIGEQTSNQADTYRAISAADSNFGLLTQTFKKAGVNDMASPIANSINNWVQKGIWGNSDVINFQSAVSTLQTEYATVLGRGGEVTDSVRKSAQNVISGNYSMNDLISLHDYIDKEGKNVIDSYTKTIQSLASGGIGSGGAGPGGSTGGSVYNGITLPH